MRCVSLPEKLSTDSWQRQTLPDNNVGQRQTTLVKQLLTISTNKTAKMSLLPLPLLLSPFIFPLGLLPCWQLG